MRFKNKNYIRGSSCSGVGEDLIVTQLASACAKVLASTSDVNEVISTLGNGTVPTIHSVSLCHV